jgi:hypothetical protein
MIQVAAFTVSDFGIYMRFLNKEQDKPALVFHNLCDALKPLLDDEVLGITMSACIFHRLKVGKRSVFQPLDT